MSELNTVVNETLLADDNQASVSAMLNAILEKPLTPMEANQAKTYMEQVASQAATDEGAEVQLFQLMEMKNQHTTYVMRVALFSNNKAIGLDVMDAESVCRPAKSHSDCVSVWRDLSRRRATHAV